MKAMRADAAAAPATLARAGARRRSRRRRSLGNAGTGLLFILPAALVFAGFIAYPVIETVRLSFYDWNGIDPGRLWIGLDNYRELFQQDDLFWKAVRNTLLWMVVSVPAQILLGLVFALLLDRKLRGRTFFRTVFFLPAVMSSAVIAFAWSWIYNPEIGVVNGVLRFFGLHGQTWLSEPRAAIWAALALSIWRYCGFIMVFYLAALQLIPASLYEAAKVDGASEWGQIRSITLPLLRPMTGLLVVLGTIGALREFDVIWILTKGGPAHATDLLSTRVYDEAFNLSRPGYGAAIAVVMLGMTLVAAAAALALLAREQRSVS